ncbi:hypothetical protein CEE44_02340 [Candidatus Woesearchaeota archaeon B3_Woes]|nr:MAG: hypothetical protein CEE44_02340 [Candidatus Woesearchaeota archaeon B3_Woes]
MGGVRMKPKLKDYLSAGIAALKVKFNIKVPLRVTYIVTNSCNLRCKYCYADSFSKKSDMNTCQVKNMMKEFKDLGTKIWKFGGGEPLIRNDIEDLIEYGRKLGFIISIDTNGTLTSKKIHILKKVDNVQISIDGPKKIHDAIRGEGVFNKCIESINILNKIGIKPMINCVISDKNIDYIEEMVLLAKKHNAYINFQTVVPVTNRSKEMISKKLIEKDVFNKIIALKKKYDFIAVSDASLKRFRDYYSGKIKKFQKKCLAGKIYCIVSPSGEVSRCISELGTKKISGLEKGFGKAFKNLSKDYGCDCTFCNYYDLSNLYSLNLKRIIRAYNNLRKGRWIYN